MSLFRTIRAFFGGMGMHGKIQPWQPKVPDYMTAAAVKFLKWAVKWELKERKTNKVLIDKSLIHSGDFLPVLRLDGKGPMQMFGTGGRIDHSVMALWFDDQGYRELYIVESMDGGTYWPVDRI